MARKEGKPVVFRRNEGRGLPVRREISILSKTAGARDETQVSSTA
jgi:hypothetical protein